jgi:hypothetical protein
MGEKFMSAIANGDTKQFVKSAMGTAGFLSAYQLRGSEYAGERWYEIRPSVDVARALGIEINEKGIPGTIDMRPFNPFSSYVFAADVALKWNEDRLHQITTKDIVMGMASTNLRAGAGLYVVDQFLDSMATAYQSGGPESVKDFLGAVSKGAAEYTSTIWSGMLVPMQQIKDIVMHFDESQRTLRDASAEPLLGQFKRRIPYADETLPEVQLPTRAAAPRTENPVGRQTTGMTVRGPKNSAERELDRMGFTRGNILSGSGDDEFDRISAKHMGPLVEKIITPFVESEAYKGMSDEMKNSMMEKMLAKVRSGAKAMASAERPDLSMKTREGRRSKRDQRLRKKLMDRSADMEKLRRSTSG